MVSSVLCRERATQPRRFLIHDPVEPRWNSTKYRVTKHHSIYSNSSNRCMFHVVVFFCCCCYSLCGRPPWSPVFPVWAGLPFRTLPVGFTLHRFWFHRRCPRMRSEAHTKCLCWIVPGSRATFSASCTIFGEIQRSHSPTDDGRDRARFIHKIDLTSAR